MWLVLEDDHAAGGSRANQCSLSFPRGCGAVGFTSTLTALISCAAGSFAAAIQYELSAAIRADGLGVHHPRLIGGEEKREMRDILGQFPSRTGSHSTGSHRLRDVPGRSARPLVR